MSVIALPSSTSEERIPISTMIKVGSFTVTWSWSVGGTKEDGLGSHA